MLIERLNIFEWYVGTCGSKKDTKKTCFRGDCRFGPLSGENCQLVTDEPVEFEK